MCELSQHHIAPGLGTQPPHYDVTAPALSRRRREIAQNSVCRIEIGQIGAGQNAVGTGFLVGPNLVLTNWHVVNSALKADGTSIATGQTIECRFDFEDGSNGGSLPGVSIGVIECLSFGLPSEPEIEADPTRGAPQFNELDYALLKLESDAGNAPPAYFGEIRNRGWINLSEAENDRALPAHALIIHHPRTETKRESYLKELKLAWNNNDPDRIRYAMAGLGTMPGSSGAPVLDNFSAPIGLHHYGDTNTSYHFEGSSPIGQAIPILAIWKKLKSEQLQFTNFLDDEIQLGATVRELLIGRQVTAAAKAALNTLTDDLATVESLIELQASFFERLYLFNKNISILIGVAQLPHEWIKTSKTEVLKPIPFSSPNKVIADLNDSIGLVAQEWEQKPPKSGAELQIIIASVVRLLWRASFQTGALIQTTLENLSIGEITGFLREPRLVGDTDTPLQLLKNLTDFKSQYRLLLPTMQLNENLATVEVMKLSAETGSMRLVNCLGILDVLQIFLLPRLRGMMSQQNEFTDRLNKIAIHLNVQPRPSEEVILEQWSEFTKVYQRFANQSFNRFRVSCGIVLHMWNVFKDPASGGNNG